MDKCVAFIVASVLYVAAGLLVAWAILKPRTSAIQGETALVEAYCFKLRIQWEQNIHDPQTLLQLAKKTFGCALEYYGVLFIDLFQFIDQDRKPTNVWALCIWLRSRPLIESLEQVVYPLIREVLAHGAKFSCELSPQKLLLADGEDISEALGGHLIASGFFDSLRIVPDVKKGTTPCS